MITVLLYLFVVIAVVAAVKVVYWLAVTRLLSDEPLADEVHTVTTDDGWQIKLLRYRQREGEGGEPVFICHGLTVNHWNLALPAHDGLVDTLAERGHDCWVVDLRGNRTSVPPAGLSRHDATFDGYVQGDIPAALAFIREQTGQDKVHWVGHSMGGLLLYAYEAVHGPDELASGTTLGAPPGFRGQTASGQRRLLSFVRRYPAIAEVYLRAVAPLVPIFKPRMTLLPINWDNMQRDVGPRAFFNLVELPPPSVAETFIDAAVFQFLGVKNNSVDVLAKLNGLRTPLLVIHGVLDPVATVENVRTFFDQLPSTDKRRLELSLANGHSADYDHIDLAFAVNGREEVYEPIAEWIEAHRVMVETHTREKRAAQPETPIPARPRPESADADVGMPVAARAGRVGMVDTVLKSAAEVLTGLEDGSTAGPSQESEKKGEVIRLDANPGLRSRRKAPASKRKAVNKKAAAKKASAKKPAAKKPGQKKAAAKKAKKKPAKKKVVAKKSAVKKTSVKKEAATKKVVKKKASKKKAPSGTKPKD